MRRNSEATAPTHPKVPTPHELQFSVHNLPLELPQWKRDMARLFEKKERVLGYYVTTKIMNEGWATFVQDLFTPYLPWTESADLIESALLKTGVAYRKISNLIGSVEKDGGIFIENSTKKRALMLLLLILIKN